MQAPISQHMQISPSVILWGSIHHGSCSPSLLVWLCPCEPLRLQHPLQHASRNNLMCLSYPSLSFSIRMPMSHHTTSKWGGWANGAHHKLAVAQFASSSVSANVTGSPKAHQNKMQGTPVDTRHKGSVSASASKLPSASTKQASIRAQLWTMFLHARKHAP